MLQRDIKTPEINSKKYNISMKFVESRLLLLLLNYLLENKFSKQTNSKDLHRIRWAFTTLIAHQIERLTRYWR